MAYIILILTVFFHSIITLGIFIGAILAASGTLKRHPNVERTFGILALLIILSYVITGACFLTTFEHYWRRTYFPATNFHEGFIAHYLTYFGIHIVDITAFWAILIAMCLGIGTTYYHHRWNKGK